MEKHGIVPEVLDAIPESVVEVVYPSGGKVDLGNELTPTQVKDEPTVSWKAQDDVLYTLVMIDPDAPSRQQQTLGPVLHWLVRNIPGNNVKNGEVIAEYRGSGPPQGTGLHRYIFLIYKQNAKITVEEKRIASTSRDGRLKYDFKNMLDKYNLKTPVAGNFYQAQYDDYVKILHANTK